MASTFVILNSGLNSNLSVKLLLRNDLPSHPPDPVIEVVADDAELPNLRGVAHVIPRPAFQPENKPFYEQNQPRSRKSFVYLQECK